MDSDSKDTICETDEKEASEIRKHFIGLGISALSKNNMGNPFHERGFGKTPMVAKLLSDNDLKGD